MAGWPSTYASYGYPTQGYQDPTAAYYAQYGYSYPGYGQGGYQNYYPQQQPVQQQPVQAPQPSYNTSNTSPIPEPQQDAYVPPQYQEPQQAEAPPAKKRTWLGRIWSFAWRAAVVAGAFMVGQWTANGSGPAAGTSDKNVKYNISSELVKTTADASDGSKLGASSPIHLVQGSGDDVFALEIDSTSGAAKLVNPDELALPYSPGKPRAEVATDLALPANSGVKALYDKLVATYQKLTTPPVPAPTST